MEIQRSELIKFVQTELICTIGSAGSPCTIPVLITLFREDTGKDIEQLAKKLNYTSIKAMLESNVFDHLIEPCFTALAKGAGNNKPKEVWCYKLKQRDDFAHILTSIEEHQLSKEEEQRKKLKLFIKDPKNQELSLEGKERILRCLSILGAENEPVPLLKLQNQYNIEWGVEMNKKELKKWFPTGKVQQIVYDFLFEETEIQEAQGQPGSLFFKMKKSFAEVLKEIEDVRKKYEEADELEKDIKRKKKKGNGNTQQQQQPKKKQKQLPANLLRIEPKKSIPPQLPKPKPVPILQKKDGIKTNKFSTDDPELFIQVKTAAGISTNQNTEELFDEISELSDQLQLEEAKEEKGKTKYTQMAEGAEATDSEAEFDENDEDEENVNHLNGGTKENGLNNASTSSNSSNNNAGHSKKDDEMTFEKAKQIQLANKRDYITLAKAKQEKHQKMHKQFIREETKKKEGKYRKIEWTGHRAEAARDRKEMQEKLLAKLEAKWIAEGKPTKKRLKNTENNQALMAALLSQMIWANERIGITEAERMLRLLLFNFIFDIDVKKFVKERIKIAKFVCGPDGEDHIVIKNANAILNTTAGYKRKKEELAQ